jgi:hypothetical protein
VRILVLKARPAAAAAVAPAHGAAKPDRARLFEIASEQGGYFTAEQARACGYGWALLSHHVRRGRFIRVPRGLRPRR